LEREFDAVERAATGAYSGFSFGEHDADSTGTLTVKVSRNVREISATYSVEDANVQLLIKLPKAYPLVAAELTTGSRAGVSEARARKWSLAVGAILRHQNGAVAAGLATWRANVDREFAGVEPCPICYLVIHGANHQLPRLRCGQCRNKFHNACLYKWFTSSSKVDVPAVPDALGRELPRVKGEEEGGRRRGDEETNEASACSFQKQTTI
jgi:hypothetical protein